MSLAGHTRAGLRTERRRKSYSHGKPCIRRPLAAGCVGMSLHSGYAFVANVSTAFATVPAATFSATADRPTLAVYDSGCGANRSLGASVGSVTPRSGRQIRTAHVGVTIELAGSAKQLCEILFGRLGRSSAFSKIYNEQRTAYRLANGIRSQTHPVPALQTRNGWFEAPWWIYRAAEPTRRHLFARIEGDDLMLSDQAGWQAVIEGRWTVKTR